MELHNFSAFNITVSRDIQQVYIHIYIYIYIYIYEEKICIKRNINANSTKVLCLESEKKQRERERQNKKKREIKREKERERERERKRKRKKKEETQRKSEKERMKRHDHMALPKRTCAPIGPWKFREDIFAEVAHARVELLLCRAPHCCQQQFLLNMESNITIELAQQNNKNEKQTMEPMNLDGFKDGTQFISILGVNINR
jgi:hypothetical protein